MQTTQYTLTTAKKGVAFRAAVVADLHDRSFDAILPILRRESPDFILIPGDLTENLGLASAGSVRPGLDMLAACAAIAPTFYALGNHEIGGCHGALYRARLTGGGMPAFEMAPVWREKIYASGATLLDEGFVRWRGLSIGGLGSGLLSPDRRPQMGWLSDFAATEGYKLLLCHHPEYYDRYLRPYDLDLIVSGHAHGGQWRFFGRGVYAPDQHLFPTYTAGVHEGRLVISRGVVNSAPLVPRLFNPCEVLMITVQGV